MTDTGDAATRRMADMVSDRISEIVASQLTRLESEQADLVEAIRTEAQRAASESESRLGEVTADAVRRIDQGARDVSAAVGTQVAAGMARLTDEATATLATAVDTQLARIAEASGKLAEMVDAAGVAAQHATAEVQKLEAERAALAKVQADVTAERAEQEKAVALLTLAGDVETNRMARTVEMRTAHKNAIAAMKADEAALEDGFDRQALMIQRGVQQYYPELQAELDRLMDAQEPTPDDTTETED